MITDKNKASFIQGYLAAALWSSSDVVDGKDVELDDYEWADGEAEKLHQDCHDFILENGTILEQYVELRHPGDDGDVWGATGFDFWLTRNGHGTGFWDRDCGEWGDTLASRVGFQTPYYTVDLFLGDDDLVHADVHPKVYTVQYRDMGSAVHRQLHFLELASALEAGRVVKAAEETRHDSWREIVATFTGYVGDIEVDFRAPPVYWYDKDNTLHCVYCVNEDAIPDLY